MPLRSQASKRQATSKTLEPPPRSLAKRGSRLTWRARSIWTFALLTLATLGACAAQPLPVPANCPPFPTPPPSLMAPPPTLYLLDPARSKKTAP